jgi:hypothetical protein
MFSLSESEEAEEGASESEEAEAIIENADHLHV